MMIPRYQGCRKKIDKNLCMNKLVYCDQTEFSSFAVMWSKELDVGWGYMELGGSTLAKHALSPRLTPQK